MLRLKLHLWLLIGLLVAPMVGCGDQSARYPVAGKVLVDDKPLTMGTIRFFPEKGRPASSPILPDGTFVLTESSLSPKLHQQGVAPGKYHVAVSAMKVIDEDADQVEWLAPSKYADFRTSDITVEIDAPRDDLLIDLTWEGNELPVSLEKQEHEPTDSRAENSTEQEAGSQK